MLFITKHIGQLCNQIWSLLPIIAYAEQTQTKVYIFNARKDYVDLFPALKRTKGVRFINCEHTTPRTNKWVRTIWRRITRHIERKVPEYKDELREMKSKQNHLIDGWEHRQDVSYIDEQKDRLIQLFTPAEDVQKKVKKTLNGFKGITIGVHVRRGDYKAWCGGAYYYADEVYVRIMKELAADAKKQGKEIRFLLCSNEPFDTKQVDLNIIQIPNADGITDLYGLASCDYIVGPPSSYSQWASFYGNVPLCLILEKEQKISLDDFSLIVRLDTFANGNRLNMNEQERFYIEK